MTDATTAASGTLSTQGTSLTPTSGSNSTSALGENDFLKLMMDQLKNQDPLNPSDPTQYMSELASFSSLEQEMNISTSASTTASQQSSSAAINLLGKTVSYTGSDGTSGAGTVTKVDFGSSGPTLTVGTTSGIAMSSVTEAS